MIAVDDTDNSYHKFPNSARVRLKPDRANVYKMAHPGSEATIQLRGLDPVGKFPMVFIEWDKDDFRTNGEHDMWTFEDHFEPVEEQKMAEEENKDITPEEAMKKMAEIFANLASQGSAGDATPKQEVVNDPVPDPSSNLPEIGLPLSKSQDEFMDVLTKAMDSASESDAFMVITVKTKGDGSRNKILVPDSYFQFNDEVAGYALQLALSSIANTFYEEAIQRILAEKFKGK